jgi:CDP-diacylglycerol--glycerol-3-phosphate 3-phosphatidyltransferase
MDSRLKLRFVTFLTFARFPLALLFFAVAVARVMVPASALFLLALALLILSAVTDLLDGYFARKWRVESRLGAHADPLMDKFFCATTFPLLVFVAAVSGHVRHAVILLVLTMLFLTRDLWVTFLRSIGSMYNVGGQATWEGKVRTCVNLVLACAAYDFEQSPRPVVSQAALCVIEAVALALTLVSFWSYTRRYWPCLRRAANRG